MCKTKRCFKCGQIKPLSEFYTHPQMADGHLNKCKECTRKDTRKRESENPLSVFKSRLKQCEHNPTQKNAYKVVESALKAGVIEKPHYCSGCGCHDSEHRIEAHHYDYSQPLNIIWLCTPCHRRMDMQRRSREGKKPSENSRPVVMKKDGKVICRFPSITEAANAINKAPHSIVACLTRANGTIGGFEWAYADTTE